MLLSAVATMAILCVFMCRPEMMRRVPDNYVLLSLFTLFESVVVGFVSAQYTQESVVIAMGITALVVVSLTIFACQTTWDFTGFGPYLFCALMVLSGFAFVLCLAGMFGASGPAFHTMRLVYAAAGA